MRLYPKPLHLPNHARTHGDVGLMRNLRAHGDIIRKAGLKKMPVYYVAASPDHYLGTRGPLIETRFLRQKRHGWVVNMQGRFACPASGNLWQRCGPDKAGHTRMLPATYHHKSEGRLHT